MKFLKNSSNIKEVLEIRNICLIKEYTRSIFKIKCYEGYDYSITVMYDGVDKSIRIEPFDRVFGVNVFTNDFETFGVISGFIDIDNIDLTVEKLHNGKKLVDELRERKEELLHFD